MAEEAADDEEVTKPEASEDENEEDPSHATSMRMRIKKIKEMIPLMFTDKDDVYVSSDDEETEKKLIQQRLYKKRLEQKAKLSSSTGNENSEEILRHIKKPEIGKKAKTSFKDRALMGINKNPAASKSSFLGKLTKSSISEGSRKRGSNVVRGYIFERDDSNSKSLNSVPEEPSVPETLQIVQEKSRPRRAPAKFTASQSQERSTTSQATTVEEEKSTRQRTTLYEILKMSSKKTSFTTGETVISSSHTESIFAAFKLDTKPVKSNPQKWLEQQDAAGTEKLLHKLKRGLQQDETSLFEDEDDNAGDENMPEDEEVTKPEASEDENEEDPSHATSMRMRIKKIKEMIPLMFTDENDVYVSSDDEETEKKLMQQRLYKKRFEQKAKFSSSRGDENSEEILRHIKKPEIGKKAKTTSFKDRVLMGINKNPAASKSSFLGKLSKSSISEGSRKRGSNVVRGYIFERDDSNSKSSNSVAEEPSVPETLQIVQEKSRPRRAPAKFTASQSQERSTTSQATTVEEEKSTRQRTTLYEILKMSSKKTSFTTGETVISSSHTESIFAAFKLDTKPVKSNPQ
ncbi:hypothetical protein F2Q70_00045456, partial [Brassica cretica]